MQRGDKAFVILFAVILVVGTVLVVVGVRAAGAQAAADGARMEATAAAARDLLKLHYAMSRYRIDATRDADGDGIGEYGDLAAVVASPHLAAEDWQQVETGLQHGGYRYRAILPTAIDDAEARFAVVALPRDGAWPVLAIDQRGDVRIAPAGFTPSADAPVDPGEWPVLR